MNKPFVGTFRHILLATTIIKRWQQVLQACHSGKQGHAHGVTEWFVLDYALPHVYTCKYQNKQMPQWQARL